MDSAIKFSSFPVKLTEERNSEEQDIKMVPITQLKGVLYNRSFLLLSENFHQYVSQNSIMKQGF